MTTIQRLAAAGTATIGEAWAGARILDNPPRPLSQGMTLAGSALTVRCHPGDNLALHEAIAEAQPPGSTLVVDYGGSTSTGPFGEVMALACQVRGIAGLITNGAVRDSVQIADMGFPVFAAGLNIRGTRKSHIGERNIPVWIGGVEIHPGDMIVADADGIVVIDENEVDAALAAAAARIEAESAIMNRIRSGETTMQIFGLKKMGGNS